MLRSVFAITNPSVVCLSVCRLSVTFVHPIQGLNLSAIFFHRCVHWPSFDLRAKFYGDCNGELLRRGR